MAAPERLSGVFSPVVMPFNDDLSPDAERLIKHCRWLLSQDVGLAVFGTNSEANSLSVEEKISLLDQLIDAGIDTTRMMPGTGHCALTDTVRLTAHAVKLGCAGALMLPPFYYKDVSDDGLYASFAEVIDRVGSDDLRIYLYHIPPIAHVGISPKLVERLVKAFPDTIVGIKDSSADWDNTHALLQLGLIILESSPEANHSSCRTCTAVARAAYRRLPTSIRRQFTICVRPGNLMRHRTCKTIWTQCAISLSATR